MNKTQNMSQRKINLPVILEHVEAPGDLSPLSLRDYLKDPDSAQFRFVRENDRRPFGPIDPWQLRDIFLSYSPDEWKSFVYMAGYFGTFRLSKTDFVEWQALLREALTRPPSEWRKLESTFDLRKVVRLFSPLPITLELETQTPTARIRIGQSLQAMIATIQLDILQGARFQYCARIDCTAPPFKLESRHERIYCSSDCAHLVAVRNSRASAKKPKRTKRRS
jgi:hypothetical protein